MRRAATRHLDEATLLRLAARDLGEPDALAAKAHLEGCAACRTDLAAMRRLDRSLTKLAETRWADKSGNGIGPDAQYFEYVGRLLEASEEAEEAAEGIVRAARAGADELAAAMRSLDGKPYRGLALLYAAQKGTPLVGVDPRRALALAEAIQTEATSLVEARRDRGASILAPREAVQAEAYLLRSQALVVMGDAAGAQDAVVFARTLFADSGDLGFGAARCDYFEGEAATFGRDYARAEKLARRALRTFAEFGLDHIVAKSKASIGTIISTRGDDAEAMAYFDEAIVLFDPEKDARALTMTLNNQATSLAQLRRFHEARAVYAKALTLALRHGFSAYLRLIRTGLAEIDFLRGQYARALRAFREIAAEYVASGSPSDVLFNRLYVAECLGRTGQFEAMAAEVEELRHDRKQAVFSPSPALSELFVCLDQRTIDADLIAHVREYLQDQERGLKPGYRNLRRA